MLFLIVILFQNKIEQAHLYVVYKNTKHIRGKVQKCIA